MQQLLYKIINIEHSTKIRKTSDDTSVAIQHNAKYMILGLLPMQDNFIRIILIFSGNRFFIYFSN